MMSIELIHGDCLEKMQAIPDGSIDMIMSDPPYGTTQCRWDSIIPFEPMWAQLKRIVKPNGAIVLMASQPFTSALIMSNVKMFKYCWHWEKPRPTGHLNARRMPMKNIEDVVIFYKAQAGYNPQMWIGSPSHVVHGRTDPERENNCYGEFRRSPNVKTTRKHPRQLIKFNQVNPADSMHPTQKPVALMEYMVKTYTNEGDTVLDFCMGSGTTGVACQNLGRDFIGIEMDAEYFEIARKRIDLARG
jgi:DNA modification methylase